MKVIMVKKTDENQKVVRRCLNCGTDITNKRRDAQFCCKECRNAYYNVTTPWVNRKVL